MFSHKLHKFPQIKTRTPFVKGAQTQVCGLICGNLCNLWLLFKKAPHRRWVLNFHEKIKNLLPDTEPGKNIVQQILCRNLSGYFSQIRQGMPDVHGNKIGGNHIFQALNHRFKTFLGFL